jgi:hypothetical protein
MQLKENNKKKNNKNKNPRDENELINKLLNKDIDYNRLVSCYYSNLFYGIIMKNKPFDMSEVNLELDKYNLKNETEKAIFYMVSMEMFYISLQRYMKVIPTDYKQGLKKINEFPKYNGKPYYHYEFFDFQDIDIKFNNRKRSFKAFVINRLYDTLIFHLECLEQKKKYNEARLDLISNSILSKEIYYKYSEKKELLDSLF